MTDEKPRRAKNRLASRLLWGRSTRRNRTGTLRARQHRGDEGLGHSVATGVRPHPDGSMARLGLWAQAEQVLGGDGVADGLAVEPGDDRLDTVDTAVFSAGRP